MYMVILQIDFNCILGVLDIVQTYINTQLLRKKITEVNLSAFVYRLFHDCFMKI